MNEKKQVLNALLSKSRYVFLGFALLGMPTVSAFPQVIPMGPGPVISVSPPPNQSAPGDETPPPAMPANPTPPPGGPGMQPPGWGYNGYLTPQVNPDAMNQGTLNVMATGYDSQGVMQQIPLFVSYNYNGVMYIVTVLNAWNPYTQQWNCNVDEPAYSTTYYINGFTYNYYTVLSTGTFYFNL